MATWNTRYDRLEWPWSFTCWLFQWMQTLLTNLGPKYLQLSAHCTRVSSGLPSMIGTQNIANIKVKTQCPGFLEVMDDPSCRDVFQTLVAHPRLSLTTWEKFKNGLGIVRRLLLTCLGILWHRMHLTGDSQRELMTRKLLRKLGKGCMRLSKKKRRRRRRSCSRAISGFWSAVGRKDVDSKYRWDTKMTSMEVWQVPCLPKVWACLLIC